VTQPPPPAKAVDNRPALAGLVLGILSLPAAVTYAGGLVLGLSAIVTGLFGIARSHTIDGAGENLSVAAIILGMLGMALPVALALFLAD
jgi:hypothetical protein